MGFIWNVAAADQPGSYIPSEKLSLISDAVLNACNAEKAVPSDKFLTNPGACHWDPGTLTCKSADAPDCLTAKQVATARKLYAGPANPVTHAVLYPGFSRGSELDWDLMIPEGGPPRFDALFKWTFGAAWDWRTFDFNRDVTAVDALLAAKVNATDPDLEAFKAHGHKLIVYHGWTDVIVAPFASIDYYESVESEQARSHHSKGEEMQDFYRLFMVPGMAHCGGGDGTSTFDMVAALDSWVVNGKAPEDIPASRVVNGNVVRTRPLCPYPQVATYKGSGSTDEAANFTCRVNSR